MAFCHSANGGDTTPGFPMKRKILTYKNFVVSIFSIAILYFAVVNVIGDTTGEFSSGPQFDPDQDNGAVSGIDGVRNASLITAVLFPDATSQRPVHEILDIPDTEPFAAFVPLDAGNAQYLASTPPGFNLFASLGPQSNVSPQTVPALAHQGAWPGYFGDRGGFPGIPGGGYTPPANNAGTNAGSGAPSPGGPSVPAIDSNKGRVPVQVASSHVPPSGANNKHDDSDDNVEDDDTTPGISQQILPIRTPSPVPEPASLLLLLVGVGVGGVMHYRKRSSF